MQSTAGRRCTGRRRGGRMNTFGQHRPRQRQGKPCLDVVSKAERRLTAPGWRRSRSGVGGAGGGQTIEVEVSVQP